MSIFTVISLVYTVFQTYPLLLQIAEEFVFKGDWLGLLNWFESLLKSPGEHVTVIDEIEKIITELRTLLTKKGLIHG
jgi:hypothetical protein